MNKKILIVSNSHDIHADVVSQSLLSLDCEPFRINLDWFPKEYEIAQRYTGSSYTGSITHLPTGRCVSIADIGSVWMRKPAEFTYVVSDLGEQERAFAKLETDHVLFGLLYSLDCFWVSHPLAMRSAMWKGEQLKRACGYGFNVPASVITNSPDEVKALNQRIESALIYKTLSTPLLGAESVDHENVVCEGLETTVVTDELLADLESVRVIPCQFQAYIPKQYELRVTVVGDDVYAAKIYSQDDPRTRVDSRNMAANVRYEAAYLPEDFAARCREFVHSYQLQYGALDFIVTPQGEYVFLENNPNGQFLYVQQLVPELNIAGAVAELLMRGLERDDASSLRLKV